MTTTVAEEAPDSAPRSTRPTRRRWWKRPWVVPLALATVLFLAFSLPPYLGLDPASARLDVSEHFPLHYPLMVTHIFAGTIAMLAVVLQVWPWLRRRHRKVHRWSGRVYVFVGVPFVGIPALIIAPLSSSGFDTRVSNTLWAVLWLTCTLIGYRMVRQRRFAEHREWMLRSFALIFAIALNRVWLGVMFMFLIPQLDTFEDQAAIADVVAAPSSWISWVLNLIVVEWWLQYRRRGARRRQVADVTG